MLLQPETRPITHEQLVDEVKGIYAGLVMVEKKCVEVCTLQTTEAAKPLKDEQWRALTALHRTLLHEHHDFFLASQHPTASPALRKLATKYAMPARSVIIFISFLTVLALLLVAALKTVEIAVVTIDIELGLVFGLYDYFMPTLGSKPSVDPLPPATSGCSQQVLEPQ